MLELILTSRQFNLKTLGFCDSRGRPLSHRSVRKFSFGLKFLKSDSAMALGGVSTDNPNDRFLLIKDFIRHPFHFVERAAKTWTIYIDEISSEQLPLRILDSEERGIRVWVCRQAVLSGFAPSDLDSSLEYDYKRDARQFDYMIRYVSLPKTLSYSFYDSDSFEFLDPPLSQAPIIDYRVVENAEIHSGRIVTRQGKIFSVSNLRNEKSKEYPGFLKTLKEPRNLQVLRSFSKSKTISGAIFIGYSASWFHFIVECLPRLMAIPRSLRNNLPVIIPSGAPLNIKKLCSALTGAQVVELNLQEKVLVKELIIGFDNGVLDPLAFDFRKNAIVEFLNEIKGLNLMKKNETLRSNRVFIRRPAKLFRPLQNEWFVLKLLKMNKFEIVSPEKMSLLEVLDCFRKAELVVAESGAGITNVLFANDHTHLIELFPAQGSLEFWPNFASINGTTVSKVIGRRTPIGLKGLKKDGFYIPLIGLQREILKWKKMIAQEPS